LEKQEFEIYAEFLAQCRELLGPFDLEKLAFDPEYKAQFFERVEINADDQIFKMAKTINRLLEKKTPGVKYTMLQSAN
jgi:hypothetical protein